jgi:hypothetical protein
LAETTTLALDMNALYHGNSIEEAFDEFRALLQVAGARTGKALIEAAGRALDALAANDTAYGFFECRGYRAKIHLL